MASYSPNPTVFAVVNERDKIILDTGAHRVLSCQLVFDICDEWDWPLRDVAIGFFLNWGALWQAGYRVFDLQGRTLHIPMDFVDVSTDDSAPSSRSSDPEYDPDMDTEEEWEEDSSAESSEPDLDDSV